MTSWHSLNRRKVWKWIFHLLQDMHGEFGLSVLPRIVDGGQEFLFHLPYVAHRADALRERWRTLRVDSDGARLERGDFVRPIDGFNSRELRTKEVLPWLRDCLAASCSEVDDRQRAAWQARTPAARRAAYVTTWHVLGLFAGSREVPVRATTMRYGGRTYLGFHAAEVALERDPGTVFYQVGDLTFIASGQAYNRHHDLLSLAEVEALGDDAAMVRHLSTFSDAEPSEAQGPTARKIDRQASQVLFAPGGHDDLLVRQDGWCRLQPIAGDCSPLPVPDGSGTFVRIAGRRWFVSTGGGAVSWPPDGSVAKVFASACDSPGVASGRTIAGGDGFLAKVLDGGIQIAEGAPLQGLDSWGSFAQRFRSVARSVGKSMDLRVGDRGRHAVLITAAPEISVYDREADRSFSVAGIPNGHPCSGDVHPCDRLAAQFSGVLCLIDLDERRVAVRMDFDAKAKLAGAFSPDGRYLALMVDGHLAVLHIATRTVKAVLPMSGAQESCETAVIDFSDDGEYLAVGNTAVHILRWPAIVRLLPRMPELTPQ